MRFQKGHPVSVETRAKISEVLKRNGSLAQPRPRGEKSTGWKGDGVGYVGAHDRVRNLLPRECALADDSCIGRLEVAFRHDTPEGFVLIGKGANKGRRYSSHIEHYWRLCHSHPSTLRSSTGSTAWG